MPPERVDVLGCPVDRLTLAQSVERVAAAARTGGFVHQFSANAAKVVAIQHDPLLRALAIRSTLVNADGVGVVLAARALGPPLPERVPGIDLMHALLARAERERWRVYFLGAKADVLDRALAALAEAHPRLIVAGARDGYFGAAEEHEVLAAIQAARPQLLFVAMGSPRTELWLGEHAEELGVTLAMGIGGSLDVVSGALRRAPAAFRRLGLEWLFRLGQEPRRLIRRNLISIAFTRLVLAELVRRRRPRRAPPLA